ncbi:glutamate--cysteine ligase, partial [Pseudomonas sp. FW305-62]
HWTIEERQALRDAVPKLGLDAPIAGGRTLRAIAGEVIDIASAGLTARGRTDSSGSNETGFLDPLREIVRSGKVPAELLLEKYHGVWNGDVSKVY